MTSCLWQLEVAPSRALRTCPAWAWTDTATAIAAGTCRGLENCVPYTPTAVPPQKHQSRSMRADGHTFSPSHCAVLSQDCIMCQVGTVAKLMKQVFTVLMCLCPHRCSMSSQCSLYLQCSCIFTGALCHHRCSVTSHMLYVLTDEQLSHTEDEGGKEASEQC